MHLPRSSAVRGIVVLVLALAIAALLEAEGLRKQAQTQPAGFKRELALDATRPLVTVSRSLHLTSPRHELQVAIGRGDEDTIDTQVHLSVPVALHRAHKARRPSRTPKPKPRSKPKPVYGPSHRLRVWVAGDSLAEIPGQALERIGGAIDVVRIESRLATGLTRPDLYNWFTRIQQAPAQLRPQLAVLSFGADDAHNLMVGVPGEASVGPFGSASWVAEYRRRVDGVTRELVAKGIHVVWLGLPIPDGPGFGKSFPVINKVLEAVAREHPTAVTYLDTWHLLDDAHGRYTPYLRVHGKVTLMRLPDGIHYTDAAGDLIAARLLDALRAFYEFRR